MKTSEDISNTLLVHGFITASALIMIFGVVFAILMIQTFGMIGSANSIAVTALFIIIGASCLALMPYCFRVARSIQILEIVGSDTLSMHPPVFVSDMNHPKEIELGQITDVSQDKILGSLTMVTFTESGDKKTIYSFLKKGKLDLIKKGAA